MKKPLFNAAHIAAAKATCARSPIMALINDLPAGRASGRPDKSWYSIAKAETEEKVLEVLIYDEIGYWGTNAADFVRDLNAGLAEVKPNVINVRINSPGGSVFEGLAIYNALAQSKIEVVVFIEGWAASIASVIAMAGDVIKIGEAAQVMIHKPWSFVGGTAVDMRKEADILDSIEEAIVDVYVARTGGDRAEIQKWVGDETWLKGQAAVDAGFADELMKLKLKEPPAKPAARLGAEFFAGIFTRLPAEVRNDLVANERTPAETVRTERDFQNFLRDLGFSGSRARAITTNGFKTREEPLDGAPRRTTALDPRDEAGSRKSAAAEVLSAAAAFPRI